MQPILSNDLRPDLSRFCGVTLSGFVRARALTHPALSLD